MSTTESQQPAQRPLKAGSRPEVRRASVVVVLGTIMAILDTTIVAVALATLARDFHTSINTIQWVTTGYLLALAVVIPLSGWAVHRFGAKPVYIISLVLFITGSALCGLARSATALIAFRVLQGLGGGMIMPVGQTIMARTAGPDKMNKVMAVIGVPTLLGPILGPVIGGVIVSNFSWRWIFFVNVPIGIVALILAFRFLPTTPSDRSHRLDVAGFCLLAPGLALLVYGLSEVGSDGGFSSRSVADQPAAVGRPDPRVHPPLAAGPRTPARPSPVQALQLLGGHRLHLPGRRHPLRDHVPAAALLPDRAGRVALDGRAAHGAPGHRRSAGHEDVGQAGRPLRSPADGSLGMALLAVGTLAYTQVSGSTSYAFLACALFVRGIGLGFGMMPVFAAAYRGLSFEEVPRASTATNIIRQVGGSIGVAVFAVVLQNAISHQFPGTTPRAWVRCRATAPAGGGQPAGRRLRHLLLVVVRRVRLRRPARHLPPRTGPIGPGVWEELEEAEATNLEEVAEIIPE